MSSEVTAGVLVDEHVRGRVVQLRPMRAEDVDVFVAYWHGGGADLAHLGIDPQKLGSERETRQRFEHLIRSPAPRPALGFTVTLDGRPVGYVNVNVLGRSRGRPHFHLVDPAVRRAGVMSTVLRAGLPAILRTVREETGAQGLSVEVRTRNAGMNRLLQRLGYPVVETRDLDDPDGLAGAGRFHLYDIMDGPQAMQEHGRYGIERLSPGQHESVLPGLADLLVDSVDGGASVGFLRGLTGARALGWWRTFLADASTTVWVARDAGGVAGVVGLRPALQESAPHRADVRMLLVHRRLRGQGVARALLAAVEREAALHGRRLLVLDTETGSAAEAVYRRLGWQPAGVVPDHTLDPDGVPRATTFFWKHLN